MSYQEYTVRVYKDCTEWRNKDGQFHRTDGPAIEYASGTKEWYQNGQQHRFDGPSVEHPDGNKYWHQNNQLHRTDGPAIEHADGNKFWYLEGKPLSETAFNAEIARRNAAASSPCSLDGKLFTAEDGTQYRLTKV